MNTPAPQIEQERFEAWLFAQPLDRVIEAANPKGCFLCSFLKETTNINDPAFSWYGWSPSGDFVTDAVKLPQWAAALTSPWEVIEISKQNWGGIRLHERIKNWNLGPITVAQMQARYIALFGDPRARIEIEQSVPDQVAALA